MATIKSHTDLSQSKTLSKILPLESADMYYISGDKDDICFGSGVYEEITDWLSDGTPRPADIPCWSLAALLGVLPKFIGDYGKCLYYDVGGYYCGYMVDGDFMLTIQETKADNPIDACVAMIEKLHEQNLL